MSNFVFPRAQPTVSVVIPTKNRAQLLLPAVHSILNQTYENWELIIVDDHSTDDTALKLENLLKADKRIRFYIRSGQACGAPTCRNEGFYKASGDYVIFLDSDDLLAPFCLSERVRVMEENADLDFAVFPCQVFQNFPGDVELLWNILDTDENDLDRLLSIDAPWATAAPIWRQKSIHSIGLWDVDLLGFQDWELHLRAVVRGLKYQKFSRLPDCFWRRPREDTIGKKLTQVDHLYSHERLFAKVFHLVDNSGLLNKHRKDQIAGMYFLLCKLWLSKGEVSEAIRVWQVCKLEGLVNMLPYQEGLIYLKLYRIYPLAKLYYYLYLKMKWPHRLLYKFSPTLYKAPLDSLAAQNS
jgi:glycosyltransferase involved in cell wall biosynthesis